MMERLKQNNRQFLAPLLIVFAGSLWGIIGLFSRSLSDAGLSPLQIAGIRCLVTAIILFSFLLLTNREYLKIKLRDFWIFIGTGVFSIALFNVFYFLTIAKSSLGIASILLYTAPCFILIISHFLFDERITMRKGVAIGLALVGSIISTGIIGGGGGSITGLTFLIGLGSGIAYALYSIIGRIALKKYNWLTVITYTFIFASIALLPYLKAGEVFIIVVDENTLILNIILLGVLSTLMPFLLYTKGMNSMETGKAALLTFVEPMVATIVGATVFQEVFTRYTAIGIVLVISSMLLITNQKVRLE